mmetsp:Transcript_19370/g.33443  ORF Transcript_19370/g.33443 Transcript_19370/m.33443 type:complete len:204 (-) Transcript_19370:895-1506(-)
MLRDLIGGAPERLQQEGADVRPVVGVNEAQGIQGASLAVRGAGASATWQVRAHQCLALLQVAPVDDSQPCCGTELGPVCGTTQPVQVLTQECIHSGACMHECVGEDGGAVSHAVARVHCGLDVLQNLDVRLVVLVEKVKVKRHRGLARKDVFHFAKLGRVRKVSVACYSLRSSRQQGICLHAGGLFASFCSCCRRCGDRQLWC